MLKLGIGTNITNADAGEIKGIQEAIACGVWFTSRGRILPKSIKFEDKSGVYHTLSGIHVSSESKKFYCGIPTIEFECDTIYNDREIAFRLLYYVEENEWKILWKNRKKEEK